MIAPASPADWLQGTTMMTLLAGVALAFSRMLGIEEPMFHDDGEDLDALRDSGLVGAVDA
jgi:hypothetical protein